MGDQQILIIGAPGAGKGTQSKRLAEEYGLEHVTTGDALRENKDVETEHGTPREYMEAGELVPDELVNEIVKEALESADGYVLDGYPRNESQVEYLEGITELDVVLHLEVGEETLVDRLTGRRVDPETGDNYHVEFDMPDDEEIRERLEQRDDDTEETVRERLRVFEENTKPVIENYEDHEGYVRIDGEQSPDEVWDDIREAVNERTA
ncbi:adenylate kinase [Halalkalicoccus ordinarius]|uniref:adenylate kinase n=1 Tax=Halalkalicoccus ordinarius TaxID=3116651 RepID=UPI00300E9838